MSPTREEVSRAVLTNTQTSQAVTSSRPTMVAMIHHRGMRTGELSVTQITRRLREEARR